MSVTQTPSAIQNQIAALFTLPSVKQLSRTQLIEACVEQKEAFISACGALATWMPSGETGRIPKDTYMVKRPESEETIDWSSPACIPMEPETFDMLLADTEHILKQKKELFTCNHTLGADPSYALPLRVLTDSALSALFSDNMFRPADLDLSTSVFKGEKFTLIALPYSKIPVEKYGGRLRDANGKTANMCVAMDFDRKIGIVFGIAYGGAIKKTLFTVMNYYLPEHEILPLHCSANENKKGEVTLFLGLSGTGKTTLSNDPKLLLIGDDEHGWSDNGIANFENGCFAKLIHLDPRKEAQIYEAVFTPRPYREHGSIVENAMMYPSGAFDLDDDRFTENSRVSYPLSFLPSHKENAQGSHPKTIVFLTADANGVIPPLAKLTPPQAMFWFLMGYTSKLAGTEAGITTPVSTFSRFFGGPFMPRNPEEYAKLLGDKMEKHNSNVYLINTGWSGGPYGIGSRMDITLTRAIVDAVLSGKIENVPYHEDPLWHVLIPESCQGVDTSLLDPRATWEDKDAYDKKAKELAQEFASAFDKSFGKTVLDPAIRAACPGK
ncbi:MAG: phosphoenolpyruvate carboxykinase (ATP) [Patescibacteria group bacterium]